jgi:type IV secretion system protein VirB4
MAHVEGHRSSWRITPRATRELRLLNTVYRNLADDNVTIYTHLIRHPDFAKRRTTPIPLAIRDRTRRSIPVAILTNRLYRNDYFISLLVSPRSVLGTGFGNFRSKFGREVSGGCRWPGTRAGGSVVRAGQWVGGFQHPAAGRVRA